MTTLDLARRMLQALVGLMTAKDGRKLMKIVIFVLSPDTEALQSLCAAHKAGGHQVVLMRPTYEVSLPEAGTNPSEVNLDAKWNGPEILSPMDYLTPEDTDAIYAELEEKQRGLPSLRLAMGETLASWTGGIESPPAIWSWLPALVPYWHVVTRLVRTIERVLQREQPDAYEITACDEELEWVARVIPLVVNQMKPDITLVSGNKPVVRSPTRPQPPRRVLSAARLRDRPAVERARARLQREVAAAMRNLGGEFTRHIMLITRGARGASWFRSMASGRHYLLDEYSEGMPDALVETCQQSNTRLTIVYEGALPDPPANGHLYSERFPSFVTEFPSNIVAGIAAANRNEVREFLTHAVDEVVADPDFRAYFTFHGVELFDQFDDYLSRSMINLITLYVTQYEAWRVLLEHLRPDVIVGGRMEAKPWITVAAHESGARVASIKLGIGEEMMSSMIAVDDKGEFAHAAYPDDFLVWGEEQVRYLKSRLPEYRGRFLSVGRARTDTFIREAIAQQPSDLRAQIGLPQDGRVMLLGANYRSRYGKWPEQKWGSVCLSREGYTAGLASLVEAARQLGDGHVLVKPHPADDLEFIAECVDRFDPRYCTLLLPAAGFHNLHVIAASDLFISTVSSMFAEAAVLGRLSINVWRPDVNMIYERDRWIKYNSISYGVETFEEMGTAAIHFLNDSEAYATEVERILAQFQRFFGHGDGANALRAAQAALAAIPPHDSIDNRTNDSRRQA